LTSAHSGAAAARRLARAHGTRAQATRGSGEIRVHRTLSRLYRFGFWSG